MKKYVMLIYPGTTPTPGSDGWATMSQEEQKQVYADYEAINKTPGVTSGPPMGLPENATTVRVEGGKTLTTDGPFAETAEVLGGYYVLKVKDLDEAIGIAAACPGAKNGSIELRPITELGEEYQQAIQERAGVA